MTSGADLPVSFEGVFQERYELESRLGSGGFGTVYKARQRATGQHVAIKVMNLAAVTEPHQLEKLSARFQREMQLCAQMHHPNIVRLIDSGQTEAGVVYTVFEFVPGRNLGEMLAEQGALDPREVRHLMLQVLDALACAHTRGVVHRDLKPANIMIVPTGARRNALVLDFGIGALIQDARSEEHAQLTKTNEVLGTPSYSAPEQLRGQPPTPSSDLYSWGLVLLECLTGKRAYDGASLGDIIYKQLSPEPVVLPPVLAEHPLGRIIRCATVKDAARRDVTAEGLLRALENCDLRGLDRTTFAVPTTLGSTPEMTNANTETMLSPLRRQDSGLESPRLSSMRTDPLLVDAERRQLTAVCCGLSAWSTDSELVDVEELDELLRGQQQQCVEIARRHGGYIAGSLGDQVLVYFGFPIAHENDSRRAARAVLEIAARTREDNQRLQAERKIVLQSRIGIHTGFVVARELRESPDSSLSSIGVTPKTAMRLSSLAEPDTILASQDTYHLLRNDYAFESAGQQRLGGVMQPKNVFLLRGERVSGEPRQRSASGAQLVGREQEFELLFHRWTQVRGGAGQWILLTGEPGIGKSRLCQELGLRLQGESHTLLECRCSPEGQNSALRPVVELLERLLEYGRETTVEERGRLLEAFLTRHGFGLDESMPLFAPLLSLPLGQREPLTVPPQKKKALTLNALLSLLLEMAERQPVLLVVEDLHWADPTTLELLTLLSGELSSTRICALMSARPEFVPPWPTSGMLQLQLSRLERTQVERLVSGVTGGKSLPQEVLEQIVTRTDGVPLFIEELTRMLVQSGSMIEHQDRYVIAGPGLGLPIPSTIRDLLTARLDRLGAAKETAQVASAIGREFTPELLISVSPTRAEALVMEDLERLVQSELVQRRRRPRGTSYVFKHALIRDTAYESMIRSVRREIHTRIAATLEKQFADVVESQPELLKHHYGNAGVHAKAVDYALRAGRRAAQRSADRDAEQHLNEGLRWLENLEQSSSRKMTELDIRSSLAGVLMTTKGYAAPEVEQILERTVPLIAELGDKPELFGMRWFRWSFLLNRARHEEALQLALENLEVARASGHRENQVVAHMALGGGSFYALGRGPEAMRELEAAVALYDPERFRNHIVNFGQEPGATMLLQLALVRSGLGYMDQAMVADKRAMEVARNSQNIHSQCLALALHELHMQQRGDREEIKRSFAQLTTLCQQHAVPFWELFGRIIFDWSRVAEEPTAIDRMRADFRTLKMSGSRLLATRWYYMLADACLTLGRHDEGLADVKEAMDFMAQTNERWFQADLERVEGALHLSVGHEVAAEASLLKSLETARRQGSKTRELQAAMVLAHLLQRRGQPQVARDLLGPLCEWFKEGADIFYIQQARKLLAQLA